MRKLSCCLIALAFLGWTAFLFRKDPWQAGSFLIVSFGVGLLLIFITLMASPIFLLFRGSGPEEEVEDERAEKEKLQAEHREWQAKGLLTTTEYRARRAFKIMGDILDTRGVFLELEDGSTLYLEGDYLEKIGDYSIKKNPFPCKEFSIKRYIKNNEVAFIECTGARLYPQLKAPAYTRQEIKRGEVWRDGDIITEQKYEEIMANAGRRLPQKQKQKAKNLARGPIETTHFGVVRAFEVQQLEDEGLHFFLELKNGSTLYLSGQYLWDIGETHIEPARFPCTELVTMRYTETKLLDEIECSGNYLKPELQAPPYTVEDYKEGLLWHDGDIITDRSYDQIKADLGRRKPL